MNIQSAVWEILKILVTVAILAGCSAAPTPSPTPLPTIDVQPTFDAVSTHAAQTVVADLTLNAPTATPVTPTSTLAPTNTPAPTATPAMTATVTRVFIPWSPTPTPTLPLYSCAVTSVSPRPSDTLKVEQDFDGVWSLKNTGVKTWTAETSDFKYLSGTKLHTGGDIVDLNSDVAPNGTYTVTIDMKAPKGDGTFNTTWELVMDDGSTCPLNMTINVSK